MKSPESVSDTRTVHSQAVIGATLAYHQGDAAAALGISRRFVELAARTGSTWAKPVSSLSLGRSLLLSGDFAGARATLESALSSRPSLARAGSDPLPIPLTGCPN